MAIIRKNSRALIAIVALTGSGLAACAHHGTDRPAVVSSSAPSTMRVGTRWRVMAEMGFECPQSASVVKITDPGNNEQLTDVAATGPRDAWASGACDLGTGTIHNNVDATPSGVVAHWDGRRWDQVTVPQSSGYGSIAAISSHDVWVAGPPIHWDGRRWTVADQGLDGGVTDVAASASSGVWGITTQGVGRWDGQHWRPLNAPDRFDLSGCKLKCIATGSDGDVWVGGELGTLNDPKPAIAHYDGRQWSIIRVPKQQKFDRLAAIAVVGGDVWAIVNSGPTRWSNGRWQRLVVPKQREPDANPPDISQIVSDGHTGLWMIDRDDNGHILHWDGRRVTRLHLPNLPDLGGLASLAQVPGTTAVWGTSGTDIEANSPMPG